MNNKYFKVIAKCGHVGRKNYVPIQFAIIAKNKKDASDIARSLPRVKHHHKDAILLCDEISLDEYKMLKEMNDNDPYLKCKNIQDQNRINDFESRIVREDSYDIEITNYHFERAKRKSKKYKEINRADAAWLTYCLEKFIFDEEFEYENNYKFN